MLKLKDIKKEYYVADTTVHALKGINLCFRKNEFVSILGPSGCGKTTLLNIIGGLDKYTSGDLYISGKSTKEFKDRDWDVYRNHRIGFIFQSYNLIPHQTILGNVELALTISGISKAERTKRAKEALDRVGLKDQYNKHANQLSGGQCQRVAIARALVNEPEILLADEPTGALDTVTSVQIMDLIQEIAKERLVIMVTHNPDLAEKYSTRIVNLLDGTVLNDSNPFTEEEELSEVNELKRIAEEKEKKEIEVLTSEEIKERNKHKEEKAKMSFWTAFKLSFKNLYSKLKRTILVIIAGSIGIIGVSAVLAVSQGVKDYIASMQDDLLSAYPIKIAEAGVDYSALVNSSIASNKDKLDIVSGKVNVNSLIDILVRNEDALKELAYTNTVTQEYVNYVKNMPKEYYNDIVLNYGLDIVSSIYTDYKVYQTNQNGKRVADGTDVPITKNTRTLSLHAITEYYTALLEQTPYAEYSALITNLSTVMSQSVSNNEYISSQYDLLTGTLPKNKEDILIVLGPNDTLTDLLLAQLGYYTEDEFYNMIYNAGPEDMKGAYKSTLDVEKFSYETLLNKKFTWYPNDKIYTDVSMDVESGGKTTHLQRFAYNYEANTKTAKVSNMVLDTITGGMGINYDINLEYVNDDWSNKGLDLNVCGIVRAKEGIQYGALSSGFIYTEALAKYIVSQNINSEIARSIKANGDIMSMNMEQSGLTLPIGIFYKLGYLYDQKLKSEDYEEGSKNVLVGKAQTGIMTTFLSYVGGAGGSMGMGGGSGDSNVSEELKSYLNIKTMDLNGIGGTYLPESIEIYPVDFNNKFLVTDYLDVWNNTKARPMVYTYNADGTEETGTYNAKDLSKAVIKNSAGETVSCDIILTYYQKASGKNYIVYKLKDSDVGLISTYSYDENTDTVTLASNISPLGDVTVKNNGGTVINCDIEYIYHSPDGKKYVVYTNKDDKQRYLVEYEFDANDSTVIVVTEATDQDEANLLNDLVLFAEKEKIKYTDQIALIIEIINTMIDIVTYALVAFTALSLIVSTVMVGIITYVSVVERTKEIGVIRSLGGRKKDVSHLFNAETFMIGFASGVFGVFVTWVLALIANIIVKNVSGGAVKTIANLTWVNAVVMISISVVLTLISGLIPARSAARQDPVNALRSE